MIEVSNKSEHWMCHVKLVQKLAVSELHPNRGSILHLPGPAFLQLLPLHRRSKVLDLAIKIGC